MKRGMGLMPLLPTVLCSLCTRDEIGGFLVDFDENAVSSVALTVNPDPRVGYIREHLTTEKFGHHLGEGRVFQKAS